MIENMFRRLRRLEPSQTSLKVTIVYRRRSATNRKANAENWNFEKFVLKPAIASAPHASRTYFASLATTLGERQNENYQCDANPLLPFRPTLPERE